MIAKSLDYDQIIKDCFWEYSMSSDDILALAKSADLKEQKFLFEKLLVSSTGLFKSMKIFDRDTLNRLIVEYSVPSFNHHYMARRKNMLEYYFLGKPLTINELKWTT